MKRFLRVGIDRRVSTNTSVFTTESVLSKSNRDRTVNILKTLSPLTTGTVVSKKRAAVLVPICEFNNTLSLLLTVRAMKLRNNRGQIAFPGGMEDNHDKTLLNTALRETEEEIGILSSQVDVWGSCPAVGRPDMTVTPYLGYIGHVDPVTLRTNAQEVEKAFTVPLLDMCNPKNFRMTEFRTKQGNYALPVFITPDFRIWGLTALIAHTILLALLPQHYQNKVQKHLMSSVSLPSTLPS